MKMRREIAAERTSYQFRARTSRRTVHLAAIGSTRYEVACLGETRSGLDSVISIAESLVSHVVKNS
jgi:hypothetical protein